MAERNIAMKKTLFLLVGLVILPAFGQEEIVPRPPKRPWTDNELVRLIRDTRIGERRSRTWARKDIGDV